MLQHGTDTMNVAASPRSCCGLSMRRSWVGLTVSTLIIPIALASAQSPDSPPHNPYAATSGSASAPAPTPSTTDVPQQVVWLKSGAVLRGSLVEFVPNSRVVLQLATGEVRTIDWADVDRASWVRPTAPAPVLPAASAAPAEPQPKSDPKPDGVVIHLVGDRPGLRLEARPRYGEGSWRTLCSAPCGSRLDVHRQSLRVTGAGTTPSNPFHFEGRSGEETLDVNAGSIEMNRWGERSLVTGIALALAGGLAYGLGRVEDQDAAKVGGAIALGVGGLGILVAFPLIGTSGTTVRNGSGDRVGTLKIESTRF